MPWRLSGVGSILFGVISTMRSPNNRRGTGGRKEKRGIQVGWEFNTPESVLSVVSWFRALYTTSSAVHNMFDCFFILSIGIARSTYLTTFNMSLCERWVVEDGAEKHV